MPTNKLATFAAGCFWGIEEAFRRSGLALSTRVGYCGGHRESPTYHDVCTGTTGHAESVEISYDPKNVTYKQLVDLFWSIHDPSQLNRQGPDVGSQYRSVIFYHDQEQKQIAQQSLSEQQSKSQKKIVTDIIDAPRFWPAEEYHQQYIAKGGHSACHL